MSMSRRERLKTARCCFLAACRVQDATMLNMLIRMMRGAAAPTQLHSAKALCNLACDRDCAQVMIRNKCIEGEQHHHHRHDQDMINQLQTRPSPPLRDRQTHGRTEGCRTAVGLTDWT